MGKGAAAAAAENVKVLVRCRPLSDKEKNNGHKSCVEMDMGVHSVAVKGLCGEADRWTFDAVINNTFSQKDIFTQFILPLVDSVLEGFNATVFAYGQSGSGKTHTMTGVMGNDELEGVIPRCFKYIFESIKATRESNPNKSYSMYVSFVELYNGKVRDLLAKQQVSLDVRENKDHTFFVQGAHIPQVKFPEEIISHMEEGTDRRRTAATELNADSSRSHSLFTLILECTETHEDGSATSVTSKLNLVDLAGSERQTKTGASGDTLKEGCNINLSLSALGTVIDCIVKGAPHVPFRSSPLTMLLKDSLGGNSKTVMFANINPSEKNLSETVSTLRFADRAKQIKNKPVVNMDSKDQKIAELTQMLQEAREKLKQYETEGTEGLEKEVETLRERVGELEVNLDNVTKSREADLVDFQNEKQRLVAEQESTVSRQAELEELVSQLRNDLQIAEATAADEKAQREEVMQVCATFLVTPPAARATEAGGSEASGSGGRDKRKRSKDAASASSASAAISSVDELATLLRTKTEGGASAVELDELKRQLHTLTAENNSLKKNLKATEKELQAKLKESKDAVKKAESKTKKLIKELEEAKRAAASPETTTTTAGETTEATSSAPWGESKAKETAALQAAVQEVQRLIAESSLLRGIDTALATVTKHQEELANGLQKELAAAKTQLAKPTDGADDTVRQFSALLREDVHQNEARSKVVTALCQTLNTVRQAWRQALAAPMAVVSGDAEAARQAVWAMESIDAQTAETQALLVGKTSADVAKAYQQRNALVDLIAASHPDVSSIDVKKEVRRVLDENEALRHQCEVLTSEKDAMDVKVRDGQRYAAMRAQLAADVGATTTATDANLPTTSTTTAVGDTGAGSPAPSGAAAALAMLDSMRAELDEARNHSEAMEKARDLLYDELKQQREEGAASDQKIASLEARLAELEHKLAMAKGNEEEVTRVETRLRERADQMSQMRALLDKQKDLIIKGNEKAEVLQEKLREVLTQAETKEAKFREALEEKDAIMQRTINERVDEYIAMRQSELGAKEHASRKLKKKIKRLEEAVRQIEIAYDEKICECEDLRNALGEQKVTQLKLVRQLEENGVFMNGGASITDGLAAVVDVDDQRDSYQVAVERARESRKKKADLFDLGEVKSVRSQARSRGSNITDDDASSGY